MIRRRRVVAALACTAASARVGAATALRIIVAYPPGGVSDAVARVFAKQLAEVLAQPVVVENRPGAGGALALGALAQMPPDGLTLGFCAISPLALAPHFGGTAPSVVPVSGVMHTPLLLVGTPALAARTFAMMLDEARGQADGLRWATSGVGTIGHLAVEQVRLTFRLPMAHIPYSGGAPQLQDALAGRFELLSTNLAPLQIDYVRTGRLTALALGAPARSPHLPEIPTFAQLGCPGANLTSLFGLFAPPGTPAAVVQALNAACADVLRQSAFHKLLTDGGNLPAPGSAAAFAREIARQSEANARLVAAIRPRR